MAIETDCEAPSSGYDSSLVWYVEKSEDKSLIICKQCQGITDPFDFEHSYNGGRSNSPHLSVSYDYWKSELSSIIDPAKISTQCLSRFLQDLEDKDFLHRLRKYNTFGENNPLLSKYPQDYLQLTILMQQCFQLVLDTKS